MANELKLKSYQSGKSAHESFQNRLGNVKKLMKKLNSLVEGCATEERKNPKDWTHVGDMAHIEENLVEIVQFLGIEIERN
jgi:hypothetical protein